MSLHTSDLERGVNTTKMDSVPFQFYDLLESTHYRSHARAENVTCRHSFDTYILRQKCGVNILTSNEVQVSWRWLEWILTNYLKGDMESITPADSSKIWGRKNFFYVGIMCGNKLDLLEGCTFHSSQMASYKVLHSGKFLWFTRPPFRLPDR